MRKIERLNELRASGSIPRVHGNGFIQLDLPDGSRLHVWDDGIPRQAVNTSKHDHAFGFESKVICGLLTNFVYRVAPAEVGKYVVYIPQRREGTEDTKLVPTGERVNVEVAAIKDVPAGSSYTFQPQVFHDTLYPRGETTATIMRKTVRLDVEPRVLVPFGEEPDNEFDREGFDPELLWPFIERALERAGA